jgi:hypothetical protein
LGDFPNPLQAMLLASGTPQEVDVWELGLRGNRKVGKRLLNPHGLSIWKDGYDCIWRQNGVWDYGSSGAARLLRPSHFSQANGRQLDFNQDYYRPFANRFAAEIRAELPEALIFIETEPGSPPPQWTDQDASKIVYAPHWYDPLTLVLKRYYQWIGADFHTSTLIFGPRAIERSVKAQLARYKEYSTSRLRGAPVIIGEFGIPFDLNGKRAYQTGNFSAQVKAMDRSMRAMEANLLSATVWNYSPDNSNARGDQWNDEDLSIYSPDQRSDPTDINSGGRALQAVVRPYPSATAGEPVHLAFDIRTRRLVYEFEHNPSITTPTELFIPSYQYPRGIRIQAEKGRTEYDQVAQLLRYIPEVMGGKHRIVVSPVA